MSTVRSKPLSDPILVYCKLGSWHQFSMTLTKKISIYGNELKCRLQMAINSFQPCPNNARLFRLKNSSLLEGKTVNYACSCCFCGVVAFTNSAQSIISILILSGIVLATDIWLIRDVFNLLEYKKWRKDLKYRKEGRIDLIKNKTSMKKAIQ